MAVFMGEPIIFLHECLSHYSYLDPMAVCFCQIYLIPLDAFSTFANQFCIRLFKFNTVSVVVTLKIHFEQWMG